MKEPPEAIRDELELIRAAAGGSRRAFDDLVRLKRERIVRTAYQITGNMDDALDVAQGVFLKLWKGLDSFDTSRRFDTWLYRVTANAAIDLIRSRGPAGTLQPLPDEPLEADTSNEYGIEQRLDRERLQSVFLRLAGRLAPKQRAAFVLREIEGRETAEVAQVMGVAESTVRNHLFQARRILRAGLESEYPELARRAGAGNRGEREPRGDRDARDARDAREVEEEEDGET